MSRTKTSTKSTNYHHGNLRESLIDAALVILERDGADSLSLRAIAAEVGVSHTAPYSHFKNKKELIAGVSEAGYELLADSFDKSVAAQGDSLDDTVLNYGASYLQFALDNPQLYRLMLGQVETRGLKESLSAPTLDMSKESITLKRPFKMLFKAFEEKLQDPEQASYQALGAWGMVHGISALLIEGHLSVPQGLDLKTFLDKMTLRR